MSIIIHIPKANTQNDKDRVHSDMCVDVEEGNDVVSINLPKFTQAKPNDLSKFEHNLDSSKYSHSSQDRISNLSFESQFIYPGRTSITLQNDFEKEIEIDTKNLHQIATPVKKSSRPFIYYLDTGNNFSSEQVIYEEIHRKAEENKK